MKINIQEVTVSTVNQGKKNYQVAEVVYTTDRGENKTKKVLSFGNPAVFAVLSKNPRGMFEAETEGAPYYNWSTLTPLDNDVVKEGPKATTSGVMRTSTYETPEERKLKQLYIIRQSSITNALKYFELIKRDDFGVTDTLGIAQEFVDFVYGTEENLGEMDRTN